LPTKDGSFLNYVNEQKQFTSQNYETNLEDSNGRAIWALGYLISLKEILPQEFSETAEKIIQKILFGQKKSILQEQWLLLLKDCIIKIQKKPLLLKELANRLVKMYQHEAKDDWHWFESYLTYGNSVLPEALLRAWISTKDELYKQIAEESFHFLLSKIMIDDNIKVISNKGWMQKENTENSTPIGGEQPIDIAYTILALSVFYKIFKDEKYLQMMNNSFNWFLGKNHMNQIVYNPATGGCYDGLEERNVNLNQGAESTVSYLIARLSL
jgi:hypothetical protein